MTSKYRSLSVRARIALTVVASVAGSLLMTGCGLGDSPTSTGTITAAAISGKINGGPNPIVGATVKIFATGGVDGSNTGYGWRSIFAGGQAGRRVRRPGYRG